MVAIRSWIMRGAALWIACVLPLEVLAAKPVKNDPPNVNIVSPANGTTFTAPATIGLVASATDPNTGDYVASVAFYSGATLIATASAGPDSTWTANWANVPAGSYSLTAQATDSGGATATSTAVNITVAGTTNLPPTVDLSAPADGATFTDPATITVSATAADSDGVVTQVEFYNGASLLHTDSSAPFSYTWSNVPAGTYTLTAKATDDQGAVTISSAATISVHTGNRSPLVVQTYPAPCSVFDETVEVFLTASAQDADGAITKVEFFQGSTLIGTAATEPYRILWTGMVPGDQVLTARATDSQGGQTTSAPVTVTVVSTGNARPTVSMTAPVDGSSHPFGAPIYLSANAADSDGSITSVEYYDGTNYIGNALTGPAYGRNWNGAALGNHTLTAKAWDNTGASVVSAPITITVEPNVAPTVSIVSPENDATFVAPASIRITVNAADSDGAIDSVRYYANGYYLTTTHSAPFDYDWRNVSAGVYEIKAYAYDNSGKSTASAPVSVTVLPNNAPSVSLTAPVSGATYDAPASITLSANADDTDGSIANVQFYNGSVRIATVTAPPYSYVWNNVAGGTYSLTARATDNGGATAISSAATITVNANSPPTVTLTQPGAGASYLAPAHIELQATAADSDGAVAQVDFYAGATLIGTATASPYSITWGDVPAGIYTLTARATDDRGATTTSSPVTISVSENAAPTVSLVEPTAGSTYTAPASLVLRAAAADSDGTVAGVEFYADTTLIGTSTVEPYSVAWDDVPAGSYILTARATDDRGATTTSSPVTISVSENAAPTVSLVEPVAGSTYSAPASVSLRATASDEDGTVASVEFYADADLIGVATASPYTVAWNDVPAGDYTLTARATDNGGAVTTSAPVTVTVSASAAPAVSMTAPTNGSTYLAPADITLTAEASDPDGSIAQVEFYNGATLIGTAVNAPYGIVWPGVSAGNYAVTAKATDDSGMSSVSTPVNLVVSALELAIIDPPQGATLWSNRALIRGTVSGAPQNSGLTVNGHLAFLDSAGVFYANDVPLEEGVNTLTATLTTPDGVQVTESILVTFLPQPDTATVTADPLEGFAPHRVTFSIEVPGDATLQLVEFDYADDGTIDWTTTSRSSYITYSTPGIRKLRVRVTDSENRITEQRFVINVVDLVVLDGTLKGVYNGMLSNLRVGNVNGALTAFSSNAYEKYSGVLAELGGNLSTIVDELGTLEPGQFTGDWAEYVILRETDAGRQAFLLYFLRGDDGVWRIEGM